MPRKLICMWLMLTLLVLSSINIYAEEKITGQFFIKNININQEEIINYELQNSFFMYGNALYMPLTPDMQKICGIEAQMDWNSNTLKLLKTKSTQKNITDRWLKNDRKDISAKTLNQGSVLVYSPAQQEDDVIGSMDVAVESLDLEGLPLIANGKTVFIPIRALTKSNILKYDTYFDTYYGICISTNPQVKAQSFFKAEVSRYMKGLTKYMRSYNKNLTETKALEYAYLFKRAGIVYGIDEKLLMAIAQKESRFNPSAVAKGGAMGMMQIMPGTAKTYGVSSKQLLDAKINIDFGAMYISNAIKRYSGNTIKGLSAYNQGGGSVDRGNYSTGYANTVISVQKAISAYVQAGNY